MATITAAATGNWSAGATWNGGVKPGAADTGDCNGFNVTLDEDITVVGIRGTTGTFLLPAATTRTINGNVTYSGSGAGIITVGTGKTLIVNGQLAMTGGGYGIAGSGSGTVTINNVGATALSTAAGAAYGVHWNSSGTLTVNGNVVDSGAAAAIIAYGPVTINGNVTGAKALSYAVWANYAGITVTINGNIVGPGTGVRATAGTVVWSSASARTIAAGSSAVVVVEGGTFNMNNVVLNNSGAFLILKTAGTLTCSGAVVNNVTPSAQAADTSGTINSIIFPKGRRRPYVRRAA